MPLTDQGQEVAIAALWHRRANKPEKIDNSSLYAGSPMYFYCICCGHLADTKPESYTSPPKQLCDECQALKDLGWLDRAEEAGQDSVHRVPNLAEVLANGAEPQIIDVEHEEIRPELAPPPG